MPEQGGIDAKAHKANISMFKVALKKAATKDNAGNPKWVGFAFAPGESPKQHVFMLSPRKKGPAVSKDLLKAAAKDHKGGAAPRVCFGQATVGKSGGKPTIWIVYTKKLGGAERKMNESLKDMHIPFTVKLHEEAEPGEAPPPPGPDIDEEETETEDRDETAELDENEEEEEQEPEEAEEDEPESEPEEEEGEAEEEEDTGAETETAEPESASAAPPAPPQPKAQPSTTPLKDGAVIWSKTRALMSANVAKFKSAVQNEYKDEPPALQSQINQALGRLDTMLQNFDDRLEQSLHTAHDAPDDASRKAELANSKKIIADYLKKMASDPLVSQLDKNPFGVDMNIKLVLTKSLTQLAKTVS